MYNSLTTLRDRFTQLLSNIIINWIFIADLPILICYSEQICINVVIGGVSAAGAKSKLTAKTEVVVYVEIYYGVGKKRQIRK